MSAPGASSTGSPSTRSVAGRPAPRARSTSALDAVEARRALERLALAAPHGAEEVAKLDQRVAAGPLDQLRGVDRRVGVRARAPAAPRMPGRP